MHTPTPDRSAAHRARYRTRPGRECSELALLHRERPMTVSTVDGTVLRIVGTVDIASTATLRDALVSLAPDLSAGGELVLDAAEIDFIDAAGLGVLVEAHGRLADSGAVLRLTCVSARFRRLLRITSLEHLMAT